MLKLIIGNKAYSSWSMRGWLALKQSGLPFAEEVVPMNDGAWAARRLQPDLAPSAGKVPTLWDGDAVLWESLAIIDHLAEKVGPDRFWPTDPIARAFARAVSSEMHAGYVDLRKECPTFFYKSYPTPTIGAGAQANVDRIVHLWHEALMRFGGDDDFLFGAFGAADIMFAPVTTRFTTYDLPVPAFARDYCRRVQAQPFVAQWLDDSRAEAAAIEQAEGG